MRKTKVIFLILITSVTVILVIAFIPKVHNNKYFGGLTEIVKQTSVDIFEICNEKKSAEDSHMCYLLDKRIEDIKQKADNKIQDFMLNNSYAISLPFEQTGNEHLYNINKVNIVEAHYNRIKIHVEFISVVDEKFELLTHYHFVDNNRNIIGKGLLISNTGINAGGKYNFIGYFDGIEKLEKFNKILITEN